MNNESTAKTVLICDTQPVTIEGLRWLLDNSGDLCFGGAVCSLDAAFELARTMDPSAILLDKGFGIGPVMDWLRHCGVEGLRPAVVVWGPVISESEALRLLQAGAKGILRRTAELDTMVACLRAVTLGTTWMEDGIFGDTGKLMQPRRSALTAREVQITELVEHGLKNRDIARTLGIQTGTVKIHLKHIFEKTGVRGRWGLALNSLREKGAVCQPSL
ncbi:MAG TPA: response regulator transcription factor [Bryobacteraceae bacterium]|nr:response regulator transcription factor [Bryobacteraceae bacterium]